MSEFDVNCIAFGISFKNSLNLIKLCYEKINIKNEEFELDFDINNIHLFTESYITDDLTKVYAQNITYKYYDCETTYEYPEFSIFKLITDIFMNNYEIAPQLEIITRHCCYGMKTKQDIELFYDKCKHNAELNIVAIIFKDDNNGDKKTIELPKITLNKIQYLIEFHNKIKYRLPEVVIDNYLIRLTSVYRSTECICSRLISEGYSIHFDNNSMKGLQFLIGMEKATPDNDYAKYITYLIEKYYKNHPIIVKSITKIESESYLYRDRVFKFDLTTDNDDKYIFEETKDMYNYFVLFDIYKQEDQKNKYKFAITFG